MIDWSSLLPHPATVVMPFLAPHPLATADAILNGIATLLLIAGYVLIRRGKTEQHKATMLAAFGVSVVFLICYLLYHYQAGSTKFAGPAAVRPWYLALLISHVVLAAVVPVLAIVTIVLGFRQRWAAHRRWAKITFPIWLYVSITGVLVYVVLHLVYPAAS